MALLNRSSAIAVTRKKRNFTVADFFIYLGLFLFMFVCVYPFYYVIIYSISDATEAAHGVYFWPAKLDFSTYELIFRKGEMQSAFLVSAMRTLLGTLLCVICTSFLSYLVTMQEMFARKVMYRLVIITMYLNAGLIPWYITMKMYGLQNNFLLYILPGAVNAYYMILVKTYIEQLPPALEESAELDGAGTLTIFGRIVMPLCKPIIATIAVYCAVGQWNSWTDNYFLVTESTLQTVQLILHRNLTNAQAIANMMKNSAMATGSAPSITVTPQSVQMAVVVIAVIPIMLVYPFLQRYFTKGIMMGAVKG